MILFAVCLLHPFVHVVTCVISYTLCTFKYRKTIKKLLGDSGAIYGAQ